MVRLATAADRAAIEEIVRAAYTPYIARIGKPPGPMLDDYGQRIAEGRVFVLVEGEAVLGVLVLIPEDDALLLDNIAVSPAAHGKGYGKQLMAFAEAWATEHGFDTIKLYTNALMTENLALYPKLGYAETHRVSEKGYSRVYMAKRLLSTSKPR